MANDPENIYAQRAAERGQPQMTAPTAAIRPIIGTTTPEEQARRAREEARDIRGEARAEAGLGLQIESAERGEREYNQRLIGDYRQQFLGMPEVRDFREVANSARQIIALAEGARTEEDERAMSDMALVFSFMKALDPGSTVREGEYASARNAAGIPDRIRTAYNNLISGEGLSPTQRAEMSRVARTLFNQRLVGYNEIAGIYGGLITDAGGDPSRQGVITYDPYDLPSVMEQPQEEEAARVSGTGDFMTAEDRELLGRLQSAYNAGAPIEELQAITAEYGRTFPLSTQEALSAARREGRGINVEPSGQRETGLLGEAAESPVGAYAIASSNALLSGGLDEIGGALGLEADVVQAAKENLRERYPVSSFAGEVSGQALQFALTRRAGVPTQFQPAAEVVQGGLYGFGEANEDRLTGAAFGAGGAVVGQQIAQRLVEPGVQAIIQRIARDTGAPREAVEQAIGEAFGPPAPPRGGAAQVPAGAPPSLPAPSQLNKPRVPTSEEMGRFSRVEEVPLENARRGQNVFAWDDFNQGRYAEPLIEGYGQTRPVAVKLENGEYIVYDGNHRASLAASQGQTSVEMDVIDARYFDPENMGRRPAPSRAGEMSDEELLAELGAPTPTAPPAGGAAPTPPPGGAAAFESVDDIIADAAERNVRLDISQNARGITLNIIDTTQAGRNQGLGTEFMQRLVDAADRSGQRIMLTPDTSFGGSSVRRLEDFYSRFGFVPNRGRNKDFEISAAMYREPSPRARAEVSPAPTPTPPPAAPTPTAPPAPSVAEQQGISEEMIALARRASGRGPGSSAARAELRAAVEADPALVQQAEALGLELPADVFSANVQLRNLTGLARSQPGSAAEAGWQQTVSNSAQQVEESLTEMGASRDLAGLSDDVFTRLNSNMESLQRQGDELREAVNANLNMQSRVEATNLEDALAQTISDLGGIDEATQAMTSQERKLLKALGVGEAPKQPTYAYMDRLRREIGDALNKGAGPWADTERVTLQRYYNALADDRTAHVARELGSDAADDLAASNRIFQAMYAARDEMTNLFGRDLDKGIGAQIRSVIAQGARGNTTNLRRLMAVIPEDMRAEVAFSGILANARSRGAEGGFSFPNFRNTYRAIRENEPVYRELARNMTESQRNFLDNLYGVSQGIADAQSRIIATGRARGGPAAEINAQSLTQKIVEQATRRGVGAGTGMLGGSLLGDVTMGIPAAVALESGLAYLGKSGTSNLDRVTDVIGSAPYRDLVNEAARGGNMTRAINRLANSKPFGLFSRSLGLDTQEARRAWISSALAVGATRQVEGEPEQAGPQAITVQ